MDDRRRRPCAAGVGGARTTQRRLKGWLDAKPERRRTLQLCNAVHGKQRGRPEEARELERTVLEAVGVAMSADELLVQAQQDVDHAWQVGVSLGADGRLPGAPSARGDHRPAVCRSRRLRRPWATVRSKLLDACVPSMTPKPLTAAAAAWNRLSNACHLHAYEMQPSVAEVEQLCGVVAGLLPTP